MAFTGFKLSDLQATIVQPGDDLCTSLKKLEQAYQHAYQYMRYKYDDSGKISTNYCQEIKNCVAKANTTSAA